MPDLVWASYLTSLGFSIVTAIRMVVIAQVNAGQILRTVPDTWQALDKCYL